MPKQSTLKPGDKVLIEGVPYSFDTRTGYVLSEPDEYNRVAVKWGMFGAFRKVVSTSRVTKIGRRKVKLSRPAIVTAVVLGVVGLLLLIGAGNYNDLVRSRNQVSNNRAQVDTEYTRRYDLIDNIVQSVQGSQAQESDVFGKIAEARKIGGSGSASAETEEQANQTIDTQIALLPRLQEAYPELRSNEQVSKLIAELQGTNNTIRDKKNAYNTTVTNYNTNITSFPKNIFAGIFNFDKEKLMEATTQERVNPKVELDRERN